MTAKDADGLQGVVFIVTVYEGVLPFLSKLIGFGPPLLSWPAHLDGPAWWLVSVAVLAVGAAVLELLERPKGSAGPPSA